MKKIQINRELFAEQTEKIKDEISCGFEDPINKIIFKKSVELFMDDLIKQLFVEEDDGEEEPESLVHITDISNYNNNTYYISTVQIPIPEPYFETMIFKCEKKIKTIDELNDDNINWSDLYSENHKNLEDAIQRHYEIVDNIDKYIERKDKNEH